MFRGHGYFFDFCRRWSEVFSSQRCSPSSCQTSELGTFMTFTRSISRPDFAGVAPSLNTGTSLACGSARGTAGFLPAGLFGVTDRAVWVAGLNSIAGFMSWSWPR